MSKPKNSAVIAAAAMVGAAAAAAPAEPVVEASNAPTPPEAGESLVDAASAELETSGSPLPGETTGEIGAEVQPIDAVEISGDGSGQALEPIGDLAEERVAPATHVDARVLAECEFGKPNDLASVPVERVAELEASFVIDTHPAAVDYARRLASGEIKG